MIINAIYGKLPFSKHRQNIFSFSFGLNELDSDYIEVTIPIQTLVSNSKLDIKGEQGKEHMIGFYDCCFGEQKRLRIHYEFHGKLHECEYANEDNVLLPQRGSKRFVATNYKGHIV